MGRRYTMFSAGQGSFRAALIDRHRHPNAEFGLVFTDVLYEDASWGDEGWCAYKGGADLDWLTITARSFTDLIDEIDAEEE